MDTNRKVDKETLSVMVTDLIDALEEKKVAVLGYLPLRCPRCGFLICCDPIILEREKH